MPQWEYYEHVNPSSRELERIGAEGWELVTITIHPPNGATDYTFKRERQEAPAVESPLAALRKRVEALRAKVGQYKGSYFRGTYDAYANILSEIDALEGAQP